MKQLKEYQGMKVGDRVNILSEIGDDVREGEILEIFETENGRVRIYSRVGVATKMEVDSVWVRKVPPAASTPTKCICDDFHIYNFGCNCGGV